MEDDEQEKDKINRSNKITQWLSDNIYVVFGIFIALLFVFPFIFSRCSIIGLGNDANEIGDVINGLTAPIIGAFSVLLVYLAFKTQYDFNTKQHDFNVQQSMITEYQIMKDNHKDILEKRMTFKVNDKHYDIIEVIKCISEYAEEENDLKNSGKDIDLLPNHLSEYRKVLFEFSTTHFYLEITKHIDIIEGHIDDIIHSQIKTYYKQILLSDFEDLIDAIEDVNKIQSESHYYKNINSIISHLEILKLNIDDFNKIYLQ